MTQFSGLTLKRVHVAQMLREGSLSDDEVMAATNCGPRLFARIKASPAVNAEGEELNRVLELERQFLATHNATN